MFFGLHRSSATTVSATAPTADGRDLVRTGSAVLALLFLGAWAAEPPARRVPTAPYVYVGPEPPPLTRIASSTGVDRFVLSFLLAENGRCVPAGNGRRPVADPAITAEVTRLRARGGAVTVASGGAHGHYLEAACTTPHQLAAAYGTALTALGADTLDVDVERDVPVGRVADALALVARRYAVALVVTVPVEDTTTGLTSPSLDLLRALEERGVDVTVNAMVMNLPVRGDRLTTLLTAAERVTDQIQRFREYDDRADAYARLGITYMAGRNDTGSVTTLADAHALRSFAVAHALGFLGFRSLNRDNGDCPGLVTASSRCSGFRQQPHAFTRSLSQGPRSTHQQAGGNPS
ncbi:glycoside hydrolase family 18 protein [Saccharomonospora glauca]|uniref:Chitinase n=1 Tax=Saccharomonospora glauca K62 TaxID=928724 RepID=I1D4Q3_9PSEU|nr:hypothetical protein [Saccharomonospora glauca]EIE99927.1 hypothetical protein SacglDRAFT_03061 [Saccharomonospora glauca K62]